MKNDQTIMGIYTGSNYDISDHKPLNKSVTDKMCLERKHRRKNGKNLFIRLSLNCCIHFYCLYKRNLFYLRVPKRQTVAHHAKWDILPLGSISAVGCGTGW